MLQLFWESLKFPTETNNVMGVVSGRHVTICDEFIKRSEWLIISNYIFSICAVYTTRNLQSFILNILYRLI